MSKHTPGPWKARKVEGPGWPGQQGWHIDYNDDQEQVTDFVYEEADANLIAAAPDLLEALENARVFIRNGIELGYIKMPDADTPDLAHETIPVIERALSKAKGQ